MNKKDTSNMMKIMGATLAVCSAAAIMGGMKTNSFSAKKTMKKAGEKVVDFVDTVAAFMYEQKSQGKLAKEKFSLAYIFRLP